MMSEEIWIESIPPPSADVKEIEDPPPAERPMQTVPEVARDLEIEPWNP